MLEHLFFISIESSRARLISTDFCSRIQLFRILQTHRAFNRFSYVGNRPINYNDPSGHNAECGLGELGCNAGTYTPPPDQRGSLDRSSQVLASRQMVTLVDKKNGQFLEVQDSLAINLQKRETMAKPLLMPLSQFMNPSTSRRKQVRVYVMIQQK